jgi:oligoribonuclease NrnB/cAMP/cGMP phosphodiesterase (DHH superfamily)
VFRIEDAYIFEKKKLDVELLDESSSTSLLFKEAQITVTIDDKHVAIKYIDSTNKLVESKFNADVEYVDDFIENISMLLKQLHFFLTHRNNYK